MKWIFAFLLAVAIFGAAALFTYKIFIRPELVMRAERESSTIRARLPVVIPQFPL